MTSFHPLLVGIHPRSERLIKTFRAYSRKKIGFDELSKVLERAVSYTHLTLPTKA